MAQSFDDKELQSKLTDREFNVLRNQGTEPPFSGIYVDNFDNGVYHCKVCDAPLFHSDNKFASSCGWPSFDDVSSNDAVELRSDSGHGMNRIEVVCAICKSHLGHVFDDGPQDTTGKRYCINSVSLDFKPKNTD